MRLRALVVAQGLLCSACFVSAQPEWVTPPAGSHQAATFTVSNNVLNNQFRVDQNVVTASGTVNPTFLTEILLTVATSNPVSGVKSLDLEVSPYRKRRDGQPWHLRGVDLFTVRGGKVAAKLAYVKG